MIQTDQYGFLYYEWPSHTWKPVKDIWQFVDIDPKYEENYQVKVGMKYILYSGLRDVYELHEITEHTKDVDLLEFIKQQAIYLLS